MPEASELAASYAHCRRITRAAARNFYFAIFLLPRAKRDALCALYAFMRHADDISDSPGETKDKLERMAAWRATLDRALAGEHSGNPCLAAFHHTVSHYAIPARYLHDLISGTEMDLSIDSYATFERLREYCYRVAGTVGLCCLHVFGFSDPRAPELAEKLGIAFQLTNILRDLRSDYEMGRVYLPLEDLAQFGCHVKELAGPAMTPPLRELMEFEAARAWSLYDEGAELLAMVDQDSRPALWALARIYSDILQEIEAREYDVFTSKVRLSTPHKTWIMLRARLGWRTGEHGFQERDRDRRRPGGALLGRRAG